MTKEVKAFGFEEALENARKKIADEIPFFVIEVINDIISDKLRQFVVDDNNLPKEVKFEIRQDEVVNIIVNKVHEMSLTELTEKYIPFKESDIFDKHWLDFEPLYRKKG